MTITRSFVLVDIKTLQYFLSIVLGYC